MEFADFIKSLRSTKNKDWKFKMQMKQERSRIGNKVYEHICHTLIGKDEAGTT